MEKEDVLENKNQSCFRWSQGSFATTLASMRPTSWTSWGRNMLAMEFGNYFNFTRGRFVVGRVRHLIGGTRHILGVYWLWEEHLFWIQTTGTEWILWTRTLQTTMQHVSGEFLELIFLLSSLILINNSCILQGTGNCQSQRHYCRLRSNLPFAQCGRDSQEPQVSQFLSHSKPTSLTDFTQSKVLTQLLPGLARVQIRWEVACQEGWAEAGEDQCKKKVTPVFFQNLWCIFTRVRPM